MTLLELLVKELPKRGGWPDGAFESFVFHPSGSYAHFFDSEGYGVGVKGINLVGLQYKYKLRTPSSAETAGDYVTQQEYEAAIAAQQPVWDGEGLPPVGCECEYKWQNDRWRTGKVCYLSTHTLLMMEMFDGEESESAYGVDDVIFRPIISEADRKRDLAIGSMERSWEAATDKPAYAFESIYDAIASGKIPGVELTK